MRPESGDPDSDGLAGAVRTAFRFLTLAVGVVLAVWSVSGVRQIQPGEQALVLRSGAVVRMRSSPGLVLAWPRPLERVLVLPAPERQLASPLAMRADPASDPGKPGLHPRQDGSYLMTADGAVVHLAAQVQWSVTDPRTHALQVADAGACLERATRAALIAACGERRLDDLLLGRLEQAQVAVRDRLQDRLDRLGFGARVHRVELEVTLPARAQAAFAQAQTASAEASGQVAKGEASARQILQEANREADRLRQAALAAGGEAVARARLDSDPITAQLDAGMARQDHGRLAREGLEAALEATGKVVAVPADDAVRLLLPAQREEVR